MFKSELKLLVQEIQSQKAFL